jgi:hypothetical protein
MQGKQAKIASSTQERAILGYLATTCYPARDRVMLLLSMKAGLCTFPVTQNDGLWAATGCDSP